MDKRLRIDSALCLASMPLGTQFVHDRLIPVAHSAAANSKALIVFLQGISRHIDQWSGLARTSP
jgi:hypothetical protein